MQVNITDLVGTARTRQGRQIDEVAFPGIQLNAFQLAEIDQKQTSYLLYRDLFQSSFKQLFHLGLR